MPLQNMTAIQTVTVGAGGASSITFSNIPQTYTDLVVKFSGRSTNASDWDDLKISINSSTTDSEYTWRALYGYSGSTVGSNTATNNSNARLQGSVPAANATSNTFGSWEIYIPNYSGSSNKSVSTDYATENNSTATILGLATNLRTVTAAITSFQVFTSSGSNFAQYSSATLYGVSSAAAGAKATGGIITQDSNYFYHTFLASGTFTPTQSLTADYLVVAGGGGSGNATAGVADGGAGGAGGLRSTVGTTGGGGSLETPLSLSATSYTVTVGAGGGATSSGSNSVFSTITSTGGGYGGWVSPGTGGSGGGGYPTGAAGTANQGYAGGQASGGGAGGTGTVGTYGVGGIGVAISALATATGTGVSNYYAGGGGAPNYAGGAGGGGAGNFNGTGTAGTANTGGGGGGTRAASGSFGGSSGGSGIVIIRYAK